VCVGRFKLVSICTKVIVDNFYFLLECMWCLSHLGKITIFILQVNVQNKYVTATK